MIYKSELRNFDGIPQEMKRAKRWVCWDKNKTPIDARTMHGASSTNPATWATFEAAEAQIGKPCSYKDTASGQWINSVTEGVGFVLGDGWTGIDLDGGADHGGGEIPQTMIDEFRALNSYMEYSKSGAGYHVIGYYSGDAFPDASIKLKAGYGVEVFTRGRYFAITGNVYGGLSLVADMTETLPPLYKKYHDIRDSERAQATRTAGRATVTAPSGEQSEFLRANIESLLAAIDPDSPREVWWRIGAALKHEGFDVSVFDAWSARGSKYKGQRDTMGVWNSFRGSGVNGGYIVKQAQESGWKPESVTESYGRKTAEQDFSGIAPAQAAQAPQAQQQPAQAVTAPEPYRFVNASEALDNFLRETSATDYKPIKTGFAGLDSKLNSRGFDPGTLSVVMAAPGTGKTALAMQIGENIAKAGTPVMVFNFEMSADQLIARSISRITHEKSGGWKQKDARDAVSAVKVLYSGEWWTLPEEQRDSIKAALASFRGYSENLLLMTDCAPFADEVVRAVDAFKAQTGKTPVVIIDYLQLMATDGKTSAVYALKDVAIALKQQIARKYNTHVMMISATSRKDAGSGEYTMQSGFGSSFIEYSADYQFALAPVIKEKKEKGKKHKRPDARTTIPLVLQLNKGRMTAPGIEQGFYFTGLYSAFEEMPDDELQSLQDQAAEAAAEKAASPTKPIKLV